MVDLVDLVGYWRRIRLCSTSTKDTNDSKLSRTATASVKSSSKSITVKNKLESLVSLADVKEEESNASLWEPTNSNLRQFLNQTF